MTSKKYLRLLVVSFIPLLLLGVIASLTVFRGDQYSNIVCNQFISPRDNCRNLGDMEGNLYKSVKSEQSRWFTIQWEPWRDNPFHTVFAEASSRLIPNVRVTRSRPYVGQSAEADRLMSSLVGFPNIALQLGVEEGELSVIDNGFAILTCHTLSIHEDDQNYSATCFGQGWGGELEFAATGDGATILSNLKSAVNEERSAQYNSVILYYLVIWPLFIYMFLIGSLIVWITRRSVAYVKAG